MSKTNLDVMLIRAVKRQACLYNVKNPEYKQIDYKEVVWRTIGKELGMTGAEVKKKWKNFRDNYKRFLQKRLNIGETCKDYKYAHELRFLDDTLYGSFSKTFVRLDDIEVSTDLSSDDEYLNRPPKKKTKPDLNNTFDETQESLENQTNDDFENSLDELQKIFDASCAENANTDIKYADTVATQKDNSDWEESLTIPDVVRLIKHIAYFHFYKNCMSQEPVKEKDLNEKLIEEVQKYDCFYNTKSPGYKHFTQKERLWHKVGKRLGISADEAKKKWKNLRDGLNKYKQRLASADGSIKPYKYLDSLAFLDEFFIDRPSKINSSPAEPEVSTDLSSDNDILQVSSANKMNQSFEKSFDEMNKFLQSSPRVDYTETLTLSPKAMTFRLFMILANKINEANLHPHEKNDLEFAVSSVVYSKLGEFYKKRSDDI